MPNSKGVLVTAGGQGSSYAFKGAGGKIDLTGRVPVLKVQRIQECDLALVHLQVIQPLQ